MSHWHCHIALDCPFGISFSIELASSSARVTSESFSVSDRDQIPYIGQGVPGPPCSAKKDNVHKCFHSGLLLLSHIIQKRDSGTYPPSPQLLVRESLTGMIQLGKLRAMKIASSWTCTVQKTISRLPSPSWSGFTGVLLWQGQEPIRSTDHSICLTSGWSQGVFIFCHREVVVVTLNYRLGVLGFLCLGSDLVIMFTTTANILISMDFRFLVTLAFETRLWLFTGWQRTLVNLEETLPGWPSLESLLAAAVFHFRYSLIGFPLIAKNTITDRVSTATQKISVGLSLRKLVLLKYLAVLATFQLLFSASLSPCRGNLPTCHPPKWDCTGHQLGSSQHSGKGEHDYRKLKTTPEKIHYGRLILSKHQNICSGSWVCWSSYPGYWM